MQVLMRKKLAVKMVKAGKTTWRTLLKGQALVKPMGALQTGAVARAQATLASLARSCAWLTCSHSLVLD